MNIDLTKCAERGAEAAYAIPTPSDQWINIRGGSPLYSAYHDKRLAFASAAIDEYRRQLAEGNAGKTPGQVFSDAYADAHGFPRGSHSAESVAAYEIAATAVLATFGGKEEEQVKQWYRELLDVIYADMPDGMNERPDPRQLVKMWKDAYGKESPAQQEAGNASPTPPPGYHIATEVERLKLPEGSKLLIESISTWTPAAAVGEDVSTGEMTDCVYACPDISVELVTTDELRQMWTFYCYSEVAKKVNTRHREAVASLQSRLAAAEKQASAPFSLQQWQSTKDRCEELEKELASLRARLNSVTEEMAERGVECEKLRAQLAALGWRPISIKPTREDADREGWIAVRFLSGAHAFRQWNNELPQGAEWLPLSRPTPVDHERQRFEKFLSCHYKLSELKTEDIERCWLSWQAARKEGKQ